jgi:hypothetical protein
MKDFYLDQHANDLKLAGSLRVMLWTQAFRSSAGFAQPFTTIFLRLADRVLYHSASVWAQFYENIRRLDHFDLDIAPDQRVSTHDITSKFDIEAYLAAAKTLFEDNFVGNGGKPQKVCPNCRALYSTGRSSAPQPRRVSLLEQASGASPGLADAIGASVARAKVAFFKSANRIRNHAYHVNIEMTDRGYEACLIKAGSQTVVSIPNVYIDESGSSVDLAQVFMTTHESISTMMTELRKLLFEFYLKHDGPLPNRTFELMSSRLGRQNVSIGSEGFEFSPFWQAKEFQKNKASSEPKTPTP